MGVFGDIERFVDRHRECGVPGDGADLPTDGYWVRLECSCGAEFECWVTEADAEADLLRSDCDHLHERFDRSEAKDPRSRIESVFGPLGIAIIRRRRHLLNGRRVCCMPVTWLYPTASTR
jgi:hypothetical protein